MDICLELRGKVWARGEKASRWMISKAKVTEDIIKQECVEDREEADIKPEP